MSTSLSDVHSQDVICSVCRKGQNAFYSDINGVAYFQCEGCGSICASREYLERSVSGTGRNYDESYWAEEIAAAKARCYGGSISRVAEAILYCRRPIARFIDISCGGGYLLDALSEMLPEVKDVFWGVEPFPPPENLRSTNSNYVIGYIDDLKLKFDAGVCVEVIEHLPPDLLRQFAFSLARISEPGALFYFNSGQPDYVINEDPGYLDPINRGHIVSYSIKALEEIFGAAGFRVAGLPGRNWAFLAEYDTSASLDAESIMTRVWTAHPHNREILEKGRFGNLMLTAGIEAARCYYESVR